MKSPVNTSAASADWDLLLTAEARAGETRVNLVRIAALLGFYANHVVQHYWFPADGPVDETFQRIVTALVVAWAVSVPLIQRLLTQGKWRDAYSYVVTAWDLALATALLAVVPGGGPHSGLLVLYFLVVAASPLRLSLRLVHFTAAGAMAGYLVQLGHYVFFVVGSARYFDPVAADLRVPRVTEIAWMLGLAVAGLLAGQVVRQARRLRNLERA